MDNSSVGAGYFSWVVSELADQNAEAMLRSPFAEAGEELGGIRLVCERAIPRTSRALLCESDEGPDVWRCLSVDACAALPRRSR